MEDVKNRKDRNNFLDIPKEFFLKTFLKRSRTSEKTIALYEYDDFNLAFDEYDFNFSTDSDSNNSFLLKPAVLKSCLKKDNTISKKMHRLPVKSSYQVKLPGCKKSQTMSRYISFNERVDVWIIPSISELLINHNNDKDDDELKLRSIWFQQDEYDTILLNLRYLIRAINDGKVGRNIYCTRGLERKLNTTKEGDEETTTSRSSLVSNLLKEQKEQYRNGIYDAQRLNQVCRTISRKDIKEATKLGILDETISRRILQD